MHYTLKQIAEVINVSNLEVINNQTITQVSIDSRTVNANNQVLFFAIVGDTNNGHDFISALINKGVTAFVVVKMFNTSTFKKDISFLKVADTTLALQEFAKHHRAQYNIPVLAITGSRGKTIIKEWLYQLLCDKVKVVRSPLSYNSQVGVPLSLLSMSSEDELGVFEAGISQMHEMDCLQNIIQPNFGLLTNIGAEHEENFHSINDKISEKLKLFKACDVLICCKDDNTVFNQIEISKIPVYTWSMLDSSANMYVSEIKKHQNGVKATIVFNNDQVNIELPFSDSASLQNAFHCTATLKVLKYNLKQFENKFNTLSVIQTKLEVKSSVNQSLIINDTYVFDLNTLRISLDRLAQIVPVTQTRVLILSDATLSKNVVSQLQNQLTQLISLYAIKKLYLVTSSQEKYTNLQSHTEVNIFNDNKSLSVFLKKNPLSNCGILVKGTIGSNMNSIINLLELKTHNTTLNINLKAVEENYRFFSSLLNPNTKKMVMLKAFAYGAGYYEMAKTLEYANVNYLGLAYIDEAILLRKKGITTSIMVMVPEISQFHLFVQYNIEPVVSSIHFLKALLIFCEDEGVFLNIHLELDTGMNRLGIKTDALKEAIHLLKHQKRVVVKSVFSHLVASNDPTLDEFTRSQIKLFEANSNQLTTKLGYSLLRHILNSSGIERFVKQQYEMVRLGVGLYGVSTANIIQNKIKLVGSLKTKITQIKKIKKGESVGYGRKFIAHTDKTIAVIPIGYADGFPRMLGNEKTHVYINGTAALVIGDICMDMCMIDISKIKVELGDEVVIYETPQQLKKLAKNAHTIPYEMLTNVSERVKRVYYFE